MGSTTALFTGLSGLNANSRNMDVIGNNIANVNTTSFRSSRMLFSSMFSRTMSMGGPPSDISGGTNPRQIGLGVQVAATQRNFATGNFTTTGDPRDMAIEGNGFFVVQSGNSRNYTRAGSFRQNLENDLVTVGGERLMGWGVDASWNVVRGDLQPVNIPIGQMTIAEQSRVATFSGNLRANGSLPTTGAELTLSGTSTSGLLLVGGGFAAAGSLLTNIEDPALPGSGTAFYTAGQQIRITGATKGGRLIPDATMTVAAGTTVQDVMTFIETTLGITSGVVNPDGSTSGVTIDATGNINIVGNVGTTNDIVMGAGNITRLTAGGSQLGSAFASTKTATADGESVRTTLVVYDSLGTPINMDLNLVMQSINATGGTTWSWQAECLDDDDVSPIVGSGTVSFDSDGQLVPGSSMSASIDRTLAGAGSPLAIDIRFADDQDLVRSLADQRSTLTGRADGSPIGTLRGFGVAPDGMIIGTFSNGLSRTLGQVPLATFTNPEGLVDMGSNMFTVSGNSGSAMVNEPGTLSAGQVIGGALETSNVDLGQEFIGLITAQTGYSAATRVISTTNEMFQQLLALGR
jgi:flagellar hook protein FlgE